MLWSHRYHQILCEQYIHERFSFFHLVRPTQRPEDNMHYSYRMEYRDRFFHLLFPVWLNCTEEANTLHASKVRSFSRTRFQYFQDRDVSCVKFLSSAPLLSPWARTWGPLQGSIHSPLLALSVLTLAPGNEQCRSRQSNSKTSQPTNPNPVNLSPDCFSPHYPLLTTSVDFFES